MDDFNIWRTPGKKKKKKQNNTFGGGFGFSTKKHKNSLNIGFGHTPKKEAERDTRRAFSQTQRNEIWDRQKGKCTGSHCGHKTLLRSATHYDHIIPWEKGGKTVVSNGQALCPTCHSVKSNKDRLKKVDKKRGNKSNDNLFGGNLFGPPSKRSKNNPWEL
ncbi:MAG: HNH endonuclease [Candidatus Aenigmarchaeota archaeon]|nr:HNH endonuclease [Candidatus Aenigmarchaeota archaeon]